MIKVEQQGADTFRVTVSDQTGESRHTVTFRDADRARLCAKGRSAEACIDAAFRFLLDREPKESILQRFEIGIIARYFPEFERELPNYF